MTFDLRDSLEQPLEKRQRALISRRSIVTSMSRGLVVIALLFSTSQLFAQAGSLPHQGYYQSFRDFYFADYKDASRSFTRGGNTAFRIGTTRYLDSICYWTMTAECYYHMGNYQEALQLYEQSLRLYLDYQQSNWQARVQLPPTIQDNNNALQQARINWGRPNRPAKYARMPDSFSVLFGRMDNERILQQGGQVQNPEMKKVDVAEIMRCVSLCLHRRRVIMGPTAKYAPFTQQIISGLSVAGSGNGTVLGSFNGVLLGIAHASNEDWKKAATILNKSIQFRGGMDHPLTSVGLLELANIGFQTKNYPEAGKLAMEASYAAAVYEQFDLIEEALSVGTTVHLMSVKTPFPPLENAIKWAGAHRRDPNLMQASLLVRLAECLAEGGQADNALTVLRQTKKPISSRNSLGNAVVTARLKYVTALVGFLKADFRGGMADLVASIKHFQTGSLWMYRLGLANRLVANGAITERQADLLYGVLLRDPTDLDWMTDPMEAITFLASSHVGALETWFDIVTDRKDYPRAITLADLVRRHRFFATLPLGGRLMAFRWMIHAPDEALSQNALDQRTKFLVSNPAYRKLATRAGLIRDSLLALPLQPAANSTEEHEKEKLIKELEQISNTQEAILASYALRREPAEMAFPRQGDLRETQKFMTPKQLVLVTLGTSKGLKIFLVQNQGVKFIGNLPALNLQKDALQLLKEMKIAETAFDADEIADTEWKKNAVEFKKTLFGEVDDSSWDEIEELVVIPDGVLWYVPVEALPVGEGADEVYLGEKLDVRYSPTLFLAMGEQRPWRELKKTAAVTARFSARGDNELTSAEFIELQKRIPDAVAFDKQIRTPTNLLASVFDQLIVWSEVKQTKGQPYALVPTQLDQSKTGATIGQWMSLPWHGPEHVIMPGFSFGRRSGVEVKAKRQRFVLYDVGIDGVRNPVGSD